jgi:hypothetical protein
MRPGSYVSPLLVRLSKTNEKHWTQLVSWYFPKTFQDNRLPTLPSDLALAREMGGGAQTGYARVAGTIDVGESEAFEEGDEDNIFFLEVDAA